MDIALALVGVWFVMSGVALDTAAAGTVEEAAEASRLGKALRPANERAVAWTRRLPLAAGFAAAAASIAMNPSAIAGTFASIGIDPAAILPFAVAVAAPAATATMRAAVPPLSDASLVFGRSPWQSLRPPQKSPQRGGGGGRGSVRRSLRGRCARNGGCLDGLLRLAQASVGHERADRRGNRRGGPFWLWNGAPRRSGRGRRPIPSLISSPPPPRAPRTSPRCRAAPRERRRSKSRNRAGSRRHARCRGILGDAHALK